MFDKTTSSLLHQGKIANKPSWYGFWLWLPILLTNLLFLRIEAFWGGQFADYRLVYVAVSAGQKILGFGKKVRFVIN